MLNSMCRLKCWLAGTFLKHGQNFSFLLVFESLNNWCLYFPCTSTILHIQYGIKPYNMPQ